jgi:hypothetical protein
VRFFLQKLVNLLCNLLTTNQKIKIMFSKSNIISTLVTAVWGYLGGWVIWGMIFDPILGDHSGNATGVMREMPDMVHLIIGCILVGFIFSTIYSKWGRENYGVASGFSFGIWIGLFLGLGEGIVNYSVMDVLSITGTLINAVAFLIFYGIMGLLAGLVYQKTAV